MELHKFDILKHEKDITKKNNKHKTNFEINKLWELFDADFKEENQIECIYTNPSKYQLNQEICVNCNSQLSMGDDNFMICSNKKCGIIYKDNIDCGAEWRYYGAEDNQNTDPTRCGMPINPLLKESSFSCKVLCQHRSSYEMHKIRRYSDWQSMPYKEKSQYDEFQLITNIAQNSGIPKIIIDEATRIHKQISETKTYRGLNRDGIIAASIYISCRIHDHPRTAKEIATVFNLDNSSATKGCKNALSIINDIDYSFNNEILTLNKTTPLDFIDRFCSKLNINQELTKLCKFVAIKIEENNIIPENTPHSIAGGIIYFVSQICNLNISKTAINNISKISEVTINKCYKKLEQYQDLLIPKIIFNKYN
jgi:transcription initiation factor TFIIB